MYKGHIKYRTFFVIVDLSETLLFQPWKIRHIFLRTFVFFYVPLVMSCISAAVLHHSPRPQHDTGTKIFHENPSEGGDRIGSVSSMIIFSFVEGVCSLVYEPMHSFSSYSTSVADPGCLSRIPDPDFYPSQISDPGSRIQKQVEKRGMKKNFCQTFFCSHKFHKM